MPIKPKNIGKNREYEDSILFLSIWDKFQLESKRVSNHADLVLNIYLLILKEEKVMKKGISFVIAALMAVSLVAC